MNIVHKREVIAIDKNVKVIRSNYCTEKKVFIDRVYCNFVCKKTILKWDKTEHDCRGQYLIEKEI